MLWYVSCFCCFSSSMSGKLDVGTCLFSASVPETDDSFWIYYLLLCCRSHNYVRFWSCVFAL